MWHTAIPGGFIVGAPAIDGDGVFIGNGHTLYRVDRAAGTINWQTSTNQKPLAQINGSPVVVGSLVLQATAGIQKESGPDEQLPGHDRRLRQDVGQGSMALLHDARRCDRRIGRRHLVHTVHRPSKRDCCSSAPATRAPNPRRRSPTLSSLDLETGTLKWSRQFTPRDVFPKGNPTGKDVDVGASPNLWRSDGQDLVGVGDKGGNYHALDRDTGKPVWQTSLTPGSVFGGVIGSAAFVDGELVMSSNVGDPKTNAPTNASKVFAVDPANGHIKWTSAPLDGKVFAPINAVPGVAFVGYRRGSTRRPGHTHR